MSKPNVRDQWFYRIIEIHRKFCTIDNVTSFIEKRDFNTILLFVSSVNKIIELDTSQQSHVDVGNKIVGTLSELVDVNEREFCIASVKMRLFDCCFKLY